MVEYATAEELKAQLQGANETFVRDDDLFQALVEEASEAIDQYTHRTFAVPDTATARYYSPTVGRDELYGLYDIASTDSLAVAYDSGDDGTFATTLVNGTDYALYVNPASGMVTNIVALGRSGFVRTSSRRQPYRVTAKYGWPAVPGPVHRACLLWATRLYVRKNSPAGVLGFGDMGVVRLSTVDPDIRGLLGPYVSHGRMLA